MSLVPSAQLLTPATVGPYLRGRGVLTGAPDDVSELGGGVSNVVLLVRQGERRLVVKQALPKLRVADEWYASPTRAIREAKALEVAGTITPGAVPEVIDIDVDSCAITIGGAPTGWRPWKESLLAGDVDVEVAGRLGAVLGAWHSEASAGLRIDGDLQSFEQLRLEPYHETVARRRPELAERINAVLEQLRGMRECLVHGDYSPKNVLYGAGGLWVIDFEVVHRGNPAFDVAFLLSHLFLKAVHKPAAAVRLGDAARQFLTAHRDSAPEVMGSERDLVAQLGCLLAARIDGKSPVEYLDDGARASVRRASGRVLLAPATSIGEVWAALELPGEWGRA